MTKNKKVRIFFIFLSLIFAILLYFFYVKYVPLITTFQIALLPVLLSVLFLTALRIESGTLFFVFAFPLINSLPYFFGIFGHIPHAPTALLLFLFYFLGWCVHQIIAPQKLTFNYPIFKPLILVALFILFSGLVNFLRFSHFYPFVTDEVYELITNVNGVTSGGALMSTLFHSLNYLTGFAFFFIILNTVKSKTYAKKIIFVLLISLIFSLIVGYYQHFKDMGFGNTPFWVKLGQINSTFKGPNPFGAFLAAVIPLILGVVFVTKKVWKILFSIIFLATVIVFPHIGTRSAFLGLAVSLLAFSVLAIKISSLRRLFNARLFNRMSIRIAVSLILIGVLVVGTISFTRSLLFDRLKNSINNLVKTGSWVIISPERYFLWKEALNMMRDYPLTGVGIGAYIIELPNYYVLDQRSYDFGLESFRRNDSAENYFLHLGAELGIGGLLLGIWIFFMIFSLLFKKSINQSSNDRDKYFYLGVAAGIISLFSNYFFHSYIGDFEIKYLFWLLVGLVFVWGAFNKQPEERSYFNKKYKILAASFVFLFVGIHLWNCTNSLSLKTRTKRFDLKQDFGFYETETTEEGRKFQWTREYGGKTLAIEKPIIEVPLLASHPDIVERPVGVRIYLVKEFFKQKRLLDEITLRRSVWKTYEYSLSEEVGNEVILLIKVSRTWNPQKAKGTPDPRDLGIAVGEIVLKDENGKV